MAGQVRQISDTSGGRSSDDQSEKNVTSANQERTSSDRSSGHITRIETEDFISVG